MSDKNKDSSFPLNLNLVLLVLALVGGILLASRRLSSNRPVNPAGFAHEHLSLASVDARLWEDPFAGWEKVDKRETNAIRQLGWAELRRNVAEGGSNLLVLAVTVPGGPYAEDRESRIRSRMAMVSALGASGYRPDDEQHVSLAELSWPVLRQLNAWTTNRNRRVQLNETNSRSLRVVSETFRARVFQARTNTGAAYKKVLLLWLDEDLFTDEPLLRFPDFVDELAEGGTNQNLALLGPRFSSTLRAMLPSKLSGREPPWQDRPNELSWISNTLSRVTLYLATPSAMDEVLIGPSETPRARIKEELRQLGFRDVHNFSATDAQLAEEVFEELKLRGIRPLTCPNHHVVLISEWDTFFGRMQSLTFAAQWEQSTSNGVTRAEYVERYQKGTNLISNLHSFVYLRGLDGERSGSRPEDDGARSSDVDRRRFKASLDELRTWMPAANHAEGPAQFDYMARIGERVVALDQELRREGRGQIRAIGIVGSDIYDTLLVLQGLREKLPNVVFFSTDLDARLWQPRELRWSRNLMVVSSYGLQLHGRLQGSVAPFRDSSQTAQFAAALCALGHPKLGTDREIPPRRFEIGAMGPVDLSVTAGGGLHPAAPAQIGRWRPERGIMVGAGLATVGLAGLSLLLSRSLRRLTFERAQYIAEGLWLKEEDLGGPEAAQFLIGTFRRERDPLIKWLHDQFELKARRQDTPASNGNGYPTDEHVVFLEFLNERLNHEELAPGNLLRQSRVFGEESGGKVLDRYEQQLLSEKTRGPFLQRCPLERLRANRELLDYLLEKLWPARKPAGPGGGNKARVPDPPWAGAAAALPNGSLGQPNIPTPAHQ